MPSPNSGFSFWAPCCLLFHPRLLLFAKAVLRLSSNGRQNHRSLVHTVLSAKLHTWQEPNGFMHLWEDWQQDAGARCSSSCASSWSCNVSCSLHWAREGCYGNAISFGFPRSSETTDTRAFEEYLSRHPFHPPPVSIDPKTALVVDKSAVLSCLKAFPEGTIVQVGPSIF